MTDDLGTSDLSSPATNGASGDSASALSVRSNGVTAAFAGGDDKELSTVAKRFPNRPPVRRVFQNLIFMFKTFAPLIAFKMYFYTLLQVISRRKEFELIRRQIRDELDRSGSFLTRSCQQ
jgi:hypothetical protein